MTTTIDPIIIDTAVFVYTDPYMKWMMPFRIVTSLIGVVVISIMMYHRKKFVAHFNLNLLLSIHVIFNLLSCLFVAIDDIYIVYQQLSWRTGGDLVLTGYECFAWRVPPGVTLYGTMFSLVVISLERFIATIFYKSYEKSPKWLGACFGVAEILIPLSVAGIISSRFDFSARLAYCTIVDRNNFDTVINVQYVFFGCEFLALVLFHISLFVNWKRMKNRVVMDPTGSYQITENFKTLLTVTPLIWCHFLIMMAGSAFFFLYSSFNPTYDPRIYPILEESANQIYWHGVLLPLIFFLLYRYGNKRDRRVLEDNGVGQREAEVVIARHEQAIQRGW